MKARVRLELPSDFPATDEEVRAAVQQGLDDLCKAEGHKHDDGLRKLPHKYTQALVDKTRSVYERQMKLMLAEIEAALLS